MKIGSKDNGLGTNRILYVNGKGRIKEELDIGSALFGIDDPDFYDDEKGHYSKGLILMFTNNSDVAGKVFNFLKEISPYEWGNVEFKKASSGNVMNYVGTSFVDGREYVVMNFSLQHELGKRNLSNSPLEYWKHTHNHPSGPLEPSVQDQNAYNVVRKRFPAAQFFIVR